MSRMYRHRVVKTEREKKHSRFRRIIQLASAVFLNGYAAGFARGRIFTGKTKALCVPVLNCYSCPGALGSCPIGSLQAVLGGAGSKLPFYVLGTLMLFGVICGRLLCGFICPFGLIQDLLHKIPTKKLEPPKRIDRPLRWVKYVILAVPVALLPVLLTNEHGIAPPYFCKYICPAGTLEGGVPLMLGSKALRDLIGPLFGWKLAVLLVVLLGSVFISRFFCRYLCPLGAFYSFFNRFSLYRLNLSREKCIGCKKCERVCPMAVEVTKNINGGECIRCGRCKAACPTGAITSEFIKQRRDEPADIVRASTDSTEE